MSYDVEDLVAELRAAREAGSDERAMAGVAERALARLVASGSWFEPRFREVDAAVGSADYLLHAEPDHSLAVFAVSWLPGVDTPPHDHHTWVAIATVEGEEVNHLWRRGAGGCRIERSVRVPAGSSLTLCGADIHSVESAPGGVTVSLHVYGMHPEHTDRRQYDPATGAPADYRAAGPTV